MNNFIMRRTTVKEVTGLANSTLYLRIQQGLFTKPVAIGLRAVGWPASEVVAINAARIAGKSNEDIKDLVKQLEADRKGAV